VKHILKTNQKPVNMNSKEQWIDEVMNSLNGMKHAQAPAGLQQRIMNELARRKQMSLRIPASLSWSLAAGLLLLVSLNIFSVAYLNKAQQKVTMKESSREMAREYFSSVSN
jgi:membrane protease subunit (stomatin/prohibitin family)